MILAAAPIGGHLPVGRSPLDMSHEIRMKTILGITDGDDAGAALLINGRLVAAVNEERLNRMKMSIGFPHLAVREVLRLAGVDPKDVDLVAMAAKRERVTTETKPNEGWFAEAALSSRIRNTVGSRLSGSLGNVPVARSAYRLVKRTTMGRRRATVRRYLARLAIHAPICYHHHHRCHSFAALATSGYPEAVSISLDGGGDGSCSHIYCYASSQIRLMNKLDSFHSIGNYYAYVTHLCGYRAGIHEGKITGLAAHGQPIYRDIFRKLIGYRDGQIRNTGRVYFHSAITRLQQMLGPDWKHADLAASIQAHLEDVAVEYVRYWVRRCRQKNVCLSGGVFANVRLNQKIAELPEVDRLFVFPAMGDGGLATGAAYATWIDKVTTAAGRFDGRPVLSDVYLGPGYSDGEIHEALRDASLDWQKPDLFEQRVAQLIADGYVVARFAGRMEYGPRALGNRSILYHPTDASVNKWLNENLVRTDFMPFAPSTLYQDAPLCYLNPEAGIDSAGFMAITYDCSPWMKQACPGVAHIDGTARPQLVRRQDNPEYYELLTEFKKLTGLPCVINTSFNMHEEPIVCSPRDAIRAFRLGHLDYLTIGSFLVKNPNRLERPLTPCRSLQPARRVPCLQARVSGRPSQSAASLLRTPPG